MKKVIFVSMVFTLFFLFINSLPTLCQEDKPSKIHVSLSVSGDKKNIIYSYLARELRSLNDVIVKDEGGRYVLCFVVLEPKYTTGEKIGGIFIATVILDNFNKAVLEIIAKATVKDNPLFQETLDSSINTLTTLCTIKVNSGQMKDLKQICAEIIAEFDTEYLEETRRSLRKSKKDNINY